MTQEILWLLNEKYNGIESSEFHADVKRLKSGVPLAYLIGWQPFCGAKIFLDSHPLIPRPETEYWITLAIDEIKKKHHPHVLDLCAGSGCVGIAVLKEIPDSTVDFVEIDESHHVTILKNVQENGIDENRARILGGSLFEKIPHYLNDLRGASAGMTTQQYDFILTNPPYIDPNLSDRVQDSVITHEPEIALFGGNTGMELIRTILAQFRQFLKSGGVLYIEHEPEQANEIQRLLPGIISEKDQFGVVRFSVFK
jgi:release factor glutamine methyltransferase